MVVMPRKHKESAPERVIGAVALNHRPNSYRVRHLCDNDAGYDRLRDLRTGTASGASHSIHHLRFDWDSPIWRPWLTLLTRHHSLIYYDWRGCGLSDRERVQFAPDRYVEDFEAVIEATNVNRFALVGMGLGTRMAMTYAVRHPEQISRLVLLGPSSCGRVVQSQNQEQAEEEATRLRAIELGWHDNNPAYSGPTTSNPATAYPSATSPSHRGKRAASRSRDGGIRKLGRRRRLLAPPRGCARHLTRACWRQATCRCRMVHRHRQLFSRCRPYPSGTGSRDAYNSLRN